MDHYYYRTSQASHDYYSTSQASYHYLDLGSMDSYYHFGDHCQANYPSCSSFLFRMATMVVCCSSIFSMVAMVLCCPLHLSMATMDHHHHATSTTTTTYHYPTTQACQHHPSCSSLILLKRSRLRLQGCCCSQPACYRCFCRWCSWPRCLFVNNLIYAINHKLNMAVLLFNSMILN